MKKLLYFAFFSFFAFFGTVIADTLNIDWLVDGETYSSTTCNYGDDLILPNTPTKYGYTFVGWAPRFTHIEYIESNGTQWIDTGFIANGGMILDTKVKPINSNLCISSISPLSVAQPGNTRNGIKYDQGSYWFEKLNNFKNSIVFSSDTPAIIHFDTTNTRLYGKANETVVVNVNNTGVLSNQTSTVKISYDGYDQRAIKGRYYYVQIKDSNGTLVRDFIPVLDDNNIACMYDRVSGRFFYNAGTGDFIAGPTISE